jgi:hypothetical protein
MNAPHYSRWVRRMAVVAVATSTLLGLDIAWREVAAQDCSGDGSGYCVQIGAWPAGCPSEGCTKVNMPCDKSADQKLSEQKVIQIGGYFYCSFRGGEYSCSAYTDTCSTYYTYIDTICNSQCPSDGAFFYTACFGTGSPCGS